MDCDIGYRFGYISDNYSRKVGMVSSTCILIVFAALAVSYYTYLKIEIEMNYS